MEIQDEILQSIEELISKFKKYPNIFLTEEDLRCYLYSRLITKREISKLIKTKDSCVSISVHSEIRWYGYETKGLRDRADLVIIDPNDLRVKNNELFKLSSKGFGFNDYYSVI